MNTDNLIPKSFYNNRLLIWKSLTVLDGLYILGCLVLAGLLSFPFSWISIIYRILIFLGVLAVLLIGLIKVTKRDIRVYKFFVLFVIFLVTKKKYKFKEKAGYKANLNFSSFDDVGVKFTNELATKSYMCAIEIKGINFSALNDDEKTLKRSVLQDIIKNINFEFCLIKIDEKIDFSKQANYLKELANQLQDNQFIHNEHQKQNYLYQMQNLYKYYIDATNNASYLFKKWYLIYYGKNAEEIQSKKNHLINEFSKLFEVNPISAVTLINVLKNIFNPINDNYTKEQLKHANLNNVIFHTNFNELKFQYNWIEAIDQDKEKSYYSISTISNWPNEANYNWLYNLSENYSTLVINCAQISRDEAKNVIQKSINNLSFMYINKNEYKESVNKEEIASNLEVIENIKDDVAHNIEKLRNYNINFLSYGIDKKELEKSVSKLNDAIKNENMDLNDLSFVQKDVFSAILPKYKTNNYKYGVQLPSITFASSFPFQDSLFIDNTGLYLGENNLANPIVLDIWNRNHRLNSNMVVLGTSGGGKSSFIKKLINNQMIFDSYVYIIDPERDYTYEAKYYDAIVLDMANGKVNKINPLQVFLNEKITDDSEAEVNNTESLIAEHLRLLETWFTTLFTNVNSETCKLSDHAIFYLIKTIKSLYQKWNLFNKNLYELKANDYPVFDDLLKELAKIKNKVTDKEDKKEYSYLYDVLSEYFTNNGMYAELYNGYSSLKIGEHQMVVFDVKNLLASKHAPSKNAQLLLMTAFIENEINKNAYNNKANKKHALLVVDEVHLFFNENNTLVLEFLSQTAKRIRKRNGALIIATQNPSDFTTTEKIQSLTKAILQNAQYTFAFSSKPQDVNAIAEIYKIAGDQLTEPEKLWISMGIKGRCLFINGYRDRQMLDVVIEPFEWNAFGNEVDQKYDKDKINEMVQNVLNHDWYQTTDI